MKRAGKEKTGPQTQVTLIQHLSSSLPYAVRIGAGVESEKTHLKQMIDELPEKSLLVGDAGFFHSELGCRLLEGGHSFVLRVGGNRTLIRELFQDSEAIFGAEKVSVWPEDKRKAGQRALRLRLIELKTRRKEVPNVFLLTNLSSDELSRQEARQVYQTR